MSDSISEIVGMTIWAASWLWFCQHSFTCSIFLSFFLSLNFSCSYWATLISSSQMHSIVESFSSTFTTSTLTFMLTSSSKCTTHQIGGFWEGGFDFATVLLLTLAVIAAVFLTRAAVMTAVAAAVHERFLLHLCEHVFILISSSLICQTIWQSFCSCGII